MSLGRPEGLHAVEIVPRPSLAAELLCAALFMTPAINPLPNRDYGEVVK